MIKNGRVRMKIVGHRNVTFVFNDVLVLVDYIKFKKLEKEL